MLKSYDRIAWEKISKFLDFLGRSFSESKFNSSFKQPREITRNNPVRNWIINLRVCISHWLCSHWECRCDHPTCYKIYGAMFHTSNSIVNRKRWRRHARLPPFSWNACCRREIDSQWMGDSCHPPNARWNPIYSNDAVAKPIFRMRIAAVDFMQHNGSF